MQCQTTSRDSVSAGRLPFDQVVGIEDGQISGIRDTPLPLRVSNSVLLPAQQLPDHPLPKVTPGIQGPAADSHETPGAPLAGEAPSQTVMPVAIELGQQTTLETNVIRATIAIVPTLYPGEPSGAVTC